MKTWMWGIAGALIFLGPPALGKTLTLDEYLKQVETGHQGLKASRETSEGAKLKGQDGDLIFAPTLTANAQKMIDEKEPASALMGNKTEVDSVNLGVSKVFSFGTQLKFNYGLTRTEISGMNPQFLPDPEYYEAKPTFEISQPLWRNAAGRELAATRELLNQQAEATRASEAFKQKMTIADAEATYWRLVMARDQVKIQKESLDRSQKIRQWNARRVKSSLADKADLYLADTAVKAREIEYQTALDEEQAARRAFNTARGIAGDGVGEGLQPIDQKVVDGIKVGSKPKTRDDVEATRAAAKISAAQSVLNREKYQPNLEVFASYAMNGRDPTQGEATSESFTSDYPTTIVGLRLSAPIAPRAIRRSREGDEKTEAAAALTTERKEFEMDRDWADLIDKLSDAKERLRLTQLLERLQKEKLDHERSRLNRGRTTTYQVLQFEQDYASSQLNRIRAQAELLRIAAQLKTFGGES